jgi:threonylcarbamoyladenosine tRNA methylthiotransferase MtaB
MPHLHLSLQSGADMILKRMKRRHLRADAVRFCKEARRLRPDIAFGADLIAGFPTETEAMLDESVRLIGDCDLTFVHVFPFSPRAGTPAARMPQFARSVIKDRAARLRVRAEAALASHLQGQVGQDVEVLMERDHVGRTQGFAEVELTVPEAQGCLLQARVTGSDGRRLRAERLATKCAA